MKKALKVIASLIGVLSLIFVIAALLFIKNLPSTWEIKQAVSPKKAQSPEFTQQAQSAAANKPVLPQQAASGTLKTHDEKVDDSKARSLRVLKEDFMDAQKPLSNVCAHLVRAEQSKFLRTDDSASAEEFTKSLAAENQKDPLVESAAPVFRYLFRLNGMRGLVDMIEQANAENDQGLFKKAEFYTKLALVGQEMRANKASLDRILMKGYNLYVLSRAVGKHPELARDPATLNFCEQIEKNANLNLDFNADEQAHEMQKFLEYAKIDPKEVDFDPNYRSDVQFNISSQTATMNHIWIEKLFAKDIEKAKKELKEVPSEVR